MTPHRLPRALRYADPMRCTPPPMGDTVPEPDDRPDRPRCAGLTVGGDPCVRRARLGSRYCRTHAEQAPVVPVAYLVETTSRRTRSPGRVHLRYAEGIRMLLCTGTPADLGGGPYPATLHPCPRCRAIAVEAVDRGELEPDDLRRFRLGEPNVDERRSTR